MGCVLQEEVSPSIEKYNFSHRLTLAEISDLYQSKTRSAREVYEKEIREANTMLKDNLFLIAQMDQQFPCSVNVVFSNPKTDGDTVLCVMPDCNASVQRPRRHLENVHGLMDDKLEFAVNCMKIFKVNKTVTDIKEKVPLVDNKQR